MQSVTCVWFCAGCALGAACLALLSSPEAAAQDAPSDLWSRNVRGVNVRLVDIGFDVLSAAGYSSEPNDVLETLQGGNHDPRQRGFTLQQIELSVRGAVDPYFNADGILVFFIDEEGESQFEVEEAFFTTQQLPFGLQDLGFEVEGGTFFTEFGRINPQHTHAWRWQDAPVVHSRFLGEDGLRGPGFRIGWLTPLPWYSELHLGMQNSTGETQVSFLANEEVFDERAIGGRPFADRKVEGIDDFTYLLRWVNAFDLSDSLSLQAGASVVLGPNATGDDGDTQILGGDVVLKWRPEENDRGWPFVVLTGELMWRRYRADGFSGDIPDEDGNPLPVDLPGNTLEDIGFYAEAFWGFRRRWGAGVRYEYADGYDGHSYDGADRISRNDDPYRSSRHRVSPLLSFFPSEFSRLRLQYNFDHARDISGSIVHSIWLGVEISFGAHPAHAY